MKDFTLYYLFKMQPNALLIWPNFYYLQKVGVTTLGLYTQLDSYPFTTLQTNVYLFTTLLLDYKDSILLTLSNWTLAWSLIGL
jgi:hypothetical protein